MTQVFLASTLFGAITIGAAIDSGLLDLESAQPVERVLIVTSNVSAPEAAPPLNEVAGFDALAHHFDRIVDWNDAIAPYHPSSWTPRSVDRVVWRRLLAQRWQLGTVTELVVESLAVRPARTLCEIFDGAVITVYADGLMSYGPTRNRLPGQIGRRIARVLHPDLVPGVRPLLLREFDVASVAIDDAVMRHEFALVEKAIPADRHPYATADSPSSGRPRPVVILGQYLEALGIMTDAEEQQVHCDMVRAAATAGHSRILFKPHPLAPARLTHRMTDAATSAGVCFDVLGGSVPAEVWFARLRPALVLGCFSTALATASQFFDLPVARLHTDLVLTRLSPYQNSNRCPATLIDATVPAIDGESELIEPELLPALLETVGYCMQPSSYPFLRPAAVEFLTWHRDERTARYLRRRRLTALDLPGRDGAVARLRATPRHTVRRTSARIRVVRRAGRGFARALVRG